MRRYRIIALGLSLAWLLVPSTARAQLGGLTINFDENGNGTTVTAAGRIFPLTSLGNMVDPVDPGNGLKPLVYDLTGSPGVGLLPVAGDIELVEIAGTSTLSDLLRFTNQGLLIIYSDTEPGQVGGDLADVGLPAARQTNLIRLVETGPENGLNGLFGYTPTANQPGFLPTPPGPAVYNFTSDIVPEPSSMVMMGTGMALLGLSWRSRRRQAA